MANKYKNISGYATESGQNAAVAIIGMDCLFPAAENLSAYWRAIKEGHDAIGDIPSDHWSVKDYYDSDPKAEDKTYGRRGGFLSPVAFEPMKYGIVPKDLSAIDSTQILGLVAADRALADAGYGPDSGFDHRRTAVLLGVTGALKMVVSLGSRLAHPQLKRALADSGVDEGTAAEVLKRFASEFTPWQENSFPGLLGNVTAGRIANRLNLGGSNLVVDAACASSLAAIRQGLMELSSGQADLVVTGGLDTFSDPFMYTCFSKTPALSPSGDVRPYDQGGDGTVLGEGIGVVILKRLSEARRDGDRIYAVIRSVGSSSDGKGTAIFAPSAEGQCRALLNAYETAGLSPDTIGLVEGHGTGTAVGDAVEVEALNQIFRNGPQAERFQPWCALGSVKAQIGHTKAAAGAAGLIKAALALYTKNLPPAVKVRRPLPILTEGDSPFHLSTRTRPWISAGPRRAAVSAFGFGGSNFHCILEENDALGVQVAAPADLLLAAFSSGSKEGLASELQKALRDGRPQVAARESREKFISSQPFRLSLVAAEKDFSLRLEECLKILKEPQRKGEHFPEGVFFGSGSSISKQFGYLLPGPESVRRNMFRELACQWPEIIQSLSEAAASLAETAPDLVPLDLALYPPDLASLEMLETWASDLGDPRLRLAAARAMNQALMRILEKFGLRPAAVVGGDGAPVNLVQEFNSKNNLSIGLWLEVGCGCDLSLAVLRSFGKRHQALALDGGGGGNEDLARFLACLAGWGLPINLSAWPGTQSFEKEPARAEGGGFTVNISGANHFVKNSLPASTRPAGSASTEKSVIELLEHMSSETALMHQELLARQTETLRLMELSLESSGGNGASPSPKALMAAKTPPVASPGGQKSWPGPAEFQAGFSAAPSPAAAPKPRQGERPDHKPAVSASSVLDIVSRETGYPVEMLSPKMNLEADLGLDSIKKVEIMAVLSEQYPEVQALGAESMSRASTLADLIALAGPVAKPVHQEYSASIVTEKAAAEPGPGASSSLWQILRTVVSSETGYPEDMLKKDMSLEMDLGLDSIKKVEIMAALGERLPEVEALADANALAGLQTLADLLALAGSSSKPIAAASAASAPVAPLAAPKPPENSSVEDILLEIVSSETGYPKEMLNLNATLEGDLGLDSIRRVEIMAAISERLGDGELTGSSAEMLAGASTLGDLKALLPAGDSSPRPAPPIALDMPERRKPGRPPKNSPPAFKMGSKTESGREAAVSTTGVSSFKIEMAPLAVPAYAPSSGSYCLMADDCPLAEALAASLEGRVRVEIISWDEAWRIESLSDLTGLIIIWPGRANDLSLPRKAFKALRAAGPALLKSRERGAETVLMGLTFMGGGFGEDDTQPQVPVSASLCGLLKTAAREWPGLRVRAVDLPGEAWGQDGDAYAASILSAAGPELPVEIGLPFPNFYQTIRLAPYKLKNIRVRHIREGQTLLVTGGARGVTAAALKEVARAFKPHLVIMGRTPLPDEEPGWLKSLNGESAIRQALFDRAKVKPGPRELARESASILAGREIKANLAAMEKAGARVTYVAGSFQKKEALAPAVNEIKRLYGPICGFIHGAGVLADSLIMDKKDEDFDLVFNTKAQMAGLILAELAGQPLNLVAFFSSSTARFGRKGQADYAAGNEVLNKLARSLTGGRQGPKCLAVNWGPWAGGMVDSSLANLFEEEGIGLIPLPEGARLFAALAGAPKSDPVEVVVLGPGTDLSALL